MIIPAAPTARLTLDRLEKVFGSTADAWLRMQMQRDLSEARSRSDSIKVTKRYVPPMAAP